MSQVKYTIRRSQERGHANHGWLNSYHTFSFANYHDPAHMGFRHLRVINDDVVQAGEGFGAHPHRDMEIITYVIKGELKHQDSMGHELVIKPGSFQHISAGKGITHSEVNPSDKKEVHLLQIWIEPAKKGLTPSYGQLDAKDIQYSDDGLTLIASAKKMAKTIQIYQDVNLYLGKSHSGQKNSYQLGKGRALWLQLIAGEIDLSGNVLYPGDAIAVENVQDVSWMANKNSEYLLFDLN